VEKGRGSHCARTRSTSRPADDEGLASINNQRGREGMKSSTARTGTGTFSSGRNPGNRCEGREGELLRGSTKGGERPRDYWAPSWFQGITEGEEDLIKKLRED